MLKAKIEAVLFLTDKPMKAQVIARTLNEDVQLVRQALLELINDYEVRNGGLEIADDNGYIVQVKDEYSSLINEFAPLEMPIALLRTLSAIAIKQPVQQAEIIKIRGAGAYDHIKELMVRELIIKKDADEGRSPMLSTTKKFQEYFRLSGDGNSLRTELGKKRKAEEKPAETGNAIQLQLEEAALDASPVAVSPQVELLDSDFAPAAALDVNDSEPPAATDTQSTAVEPPAVENADDNLAPIAEPVVLETTDSRALTCDTAVDENVAPVTGAVELEASDPEIEAAVPSNSDDDEAPVTRPVGLEQLEEIFDASPDTSLVFKAGAHDRESADDEDSSVVPSADTPANG